MAGLVCNIAVTSTVAKWIRFDLNAILWTHMDLRTFVWKFRRNKIEIAVATPSTAATRNAMNLIVENTQ